MFKFYLISIIAVGLLVYKFTTLQNHCQLCKNTVNHTIMKEEYGKLTRSLATSTPADLDTDIAKFYKNNLPRFPEEAIYIYSFKEQKMIYADGWDEVLGYKDSEISLKTIVESTTGDFLDFSMEINDKALQYLSTKKDKLEDYSFTIEIKKLHKNGTPIPLISQVGVYKSDEGKIIEIISRVFINRTLEFGKVMKYQIYGPEIHDFEELLSKALFDFCFISNKEQEALKLVASGLTFKEIAQELKISQSAVEKRIQPLYQRFNVKSISHLISFAHQNHILI